MNDDPLIGRKLANFRIERVLGRGGMAQVYYGTDVKLQRPVAIKVIDARYRSKPAYAQRFVKEARAVARWRHENIIQIYYADDEDGLYFFAMEYIDGQDLAELMTTYSVQGELLPVEDVLAIGRAVAGALDYAHKRGVIHRDVKPSNVMVSKEGRVVLGDFGLALDLQEGSSGEAFGTPHYISPEQARRSTDAVPQSDLYSLGVILYEMLTGVVPFDDQSPTSVAIQHITQPPPDPRSLNPQLDAGTAGVLLRALHKAPAERYQSGAELIDALAKALTGTKTDPSKKVLPLPPLPAAVLTGQDKTAHQRRFALDATTPSAPPAPTVTAAASRGRKRTIAGWLIATVLLAALGFFGIRYLLPAAGLPPSPTPSPKVVPVETLPAATLRSEPVKPPTGTPTASQTVTPAVTDTPEPTLTHTPEPTSTWTPVPQETSTVANQTSPVPAADATDTPALTTTATATETHLPTETLPPDVTPTEKYPNWAHLVLYYDEYGFYLKNISTLNRSISPLAFERLDEAGSPHDRFDGWRWAEFYPTLLGDRCMSIEIRASPRYLRPEPCKKRYLSMRLFEAESGLIFWTAQPGSTQFRALWREKEVARCEIGAGTCEVYIP